MNEEKGYAKEENSNDAKIQPLVVDVTGQAEQEVTRRRKSQKASDPDRA
jgi:hypothetical protein